MSDQENWPDSSAPYEPEKPSPRKEMLPRRVGATFGFLMGCLPRRRSGRRALSVLTVLMAFTGVLLLSYPFITDFQAKQRQSSLADQFGSKDAKEQYKRRQVAIGGALTRLDIPKFGGCSSCKRIHVIVVEGTSGNALRAGAGHYETTPLPGERGNVAIAGHRTGFGEPFRHIDALRAGDLVYLDTPLGRYTYQVISSFDGHNNPWVTGPRDFSVLAPTPDAVLTLTSCDPPHTSKNRLIVRAKLIKSEVVA